jgi:hypothetical protein
MPALTEALRELRRDLTWWLWGVLAEAFLVATWPLYLLGKALSCIG